MDWLNWLGQIGAWVSTWIWRVLRILWVCRVAAVSAIGGGLLIAGAEQARDLFADTGLSTGSWTLFFFLLFLWAWLVHGMGRRALQFDEWVPEAHRPGGLQDDDRVRLRKEFYWYAIVIPRLLGLVVFIATALALWSTHENLAGATALKQATAARSLTWTLLKWTVAIGAGYLVFMTRTNLCSSERNQSCVLRALPARIGRKIHRRFGRLLNRRSTRR
jgi:hypothetical protein